MSRFVWVFPAVFVITVAVALSVSAQGEIDGAVIYQERCAFCHGDQGDGNGPVANIWIRAHEISRQANLNFAQPLPESCHSARM